MDNAGGRWRMTVAMALSGTIGVLVLASGQEPLTVVLFRCMLGAMALLGLLAWRGGWTRLDRRALAWIGLGATAIIGNWLCLFSAFALCGISVATVVYHTQPFILVVLAALVQGERPQRVKLWLMLPAFAGVALTTGIDSSAIEPALVAGVLLALAAAFLYAVATLATRKLAAYAPAQIAGLQLALGALLLAPFGNIAFDQVSVTAWGALLVIGLVHTGLVYNLMYGAFQRLSAATIASLSFIYPLVAVVADLLVLDARLEPLQWLGMALILASLAASQSRIFLRIRPSPSGSAGNSA